jgi:hypothetical protein
LFSSIIFGSFTSFYNFTIGLPVRYGDTFSAPVHLALVFAFGIVLLTAVASDLATIGIVNSPSVFGGRPPLVAIKNGSSFR